MFLEKWDLVGIIFADGARTQTTSHSTNFQTGATYTAERSTGDSLPGATGGTAGDRRGGGKKREEKNISTS